MESPEQKVQNENKMKFYLLPLKISRRYGIIFLMQWLKGAFKYEKNAVRIQPAFR